MFKKINISKKFKILICLFTIIAALLFYAIKIEPYKLTVRTIKLNGTKIKTPLRIVHVSDIQSDIVGSYENKVFNTIRLLKPDIVIDTGDIIQTPSINKRKENLEMLINLFESIKPKYGIYNVIGNVPGDKEALLMDTSFITLENESVIIEHNGTNINILGLNYQTSTSIEKSKEVITQWYNKTKQNEIKIVIGHSPNYILDITDLKIDICLAGHTHGGQIKIPFIGPIIRKSELPRKWASGFNKINNTSLNVSNGIGTDNYIASRYRIPPIRFNCPPELIVIEIN